MINSTMLRQAIRDKCAIHTPTIAEAQALVTWLHANTHCRAKLSWYDEYNESMCYYPSGGVYSGITYFKSHDYTIIPFHSLLIPPILFTKVPTC